MLPLKAYQEQLRKTVKGQEEAIKIVSTEIYKYCLKLKAKDQGLITKGASTMLLWGNTGCGKTHLVQNCAEILNVPVIEINSKSISQEGWSGRSFLEIVKHELWLRDVEEGVLFIDEFDKLLIHNDSNKGDQAFHLQASLLKYMEGFKYTEKNKSECVNFSNFMFIFAGAFSGLNLEKNTIGFESSKETFNYREAMIQYGMLPEIAGRIQQFCQVNSMTKEVYLEILDSDSFIFNYWKTMFRKMDINFEYDIDKLITDAIYSNLGVRGLIQAVESQVTECINKNINDIDIERLSPLSTHRKSF